MSACLACGRFYALSKKSQSAREAVVGPWWRKRVLRFDPVEIRAPDRYVTFAE
jgi:hypothetical protein